MIEIGGPDSRCRRCAGSASHSAFPLIRVNPACPEVASARAVSVPLGALAALRPLAAAVGDGGHVAQDQRR